VIKYTSIEDMAAHHEGLRYKIYLCTGDKRTIGYGRNLDDRGISKDEAELMLKNDIKIARYDLESNAGYYYHNIDTTRQAVLIDMVLNLGWPRFSKFKKMAQALRSSDYELAAVEMLDSRWATQVGNRAIELAEMMLTGEWPEV